MIYYDIWCNSIQWDQNRHSTFVYRLSNSIECSRMTEDQCCIAIIFKCSQLNRRQKQQQQQQRREVSLPSPDLLHQMYRGLDSGGFADCFHSFFGTYSPTKWLNERTSERCECMCVCGEFLCCCFITLKKS